VPTQKPRSRRPKRQRICPGLKDENTKAPIKPKSIHFAQQGELALVATTTAIGTIVAMKIAICGLLNLTLRRAMTRGKNSLFAQRKKEYGRRR